MHGGTGLVYRGMGLESVEVQFHVLAVSLLLLAFWAHPRLVIGAIRTRGSRVWRDRGSHFLRVLSRCR